MWTVAAGIGERSRYHKDVETLDADHPWHLIRERIPDGAVVLDIGCGSGGLGRFLAGRTSAVDGIEADNERAESASEHLRTVVNAFAGYSVGQYAAIYVAGGLGLGGRAQAPPAAGSARRRGHRPQRR